MIDREFRALSKTTGESRLWHAASVAVRVWSTAWRDSLTGGVVTRAAAMTNDWTAIDRVRYGAIAIATMALGHLGFVVLFPAYVAPALPITFMVAVALLAAAVALIPRGFVSGWNQSRLRQASRHLTSPGQNNDA